ncbi:MAG TPA: hypothetical protein VIU64_17380 [Polyangia bacterium]
MSSRNDAKKRDTERAKRPELPRTEPIRSWSTLFGPKGANANGSAAPAADAPRATSAASGGGDAVRRGVELGYRVLDDYVRQGASVADMFAGPTRTWAPSAEDLPKMTERMLRYTADFTSLWFDAMRIMNRGEGARGRSDEETRAADEPAAARSARVRWVLDVRSERPAEIIVALDEPLPAGLVVEPLRAAAGKRAIEDVAIHPPAEPGGPLRVRVHIPSGVPKGRYTGAVIDAADRQPRGRLTVTLSK